MKNVMGIIVNNPCKELAALTEHRNPLTLPFFARYRLVDFELSNMVNSDIGKIGVIASDKYRSLLDHVGTGQEWGLSRKSQSMVILQGSRRVGDVKQRDINLMDFEKNAMVFERNKVDDVLIAAPSIVSKADYRELVAAHRGWGADVTLVATEMQMGEKHPECLYMNIGSNGRIEKVNVGPRRTNTHQYSSKLIIRRETLMHLMEMAPELGEYELLTLIRENYKSLNVRCFVYSGYLRRITSIKDYFTTNLELLDTCVSCELFSGERTIYTKVKDNHPALYKDTSDVKNACVASGSIVHGEVRNAVIFRQVVQEKGSSIKNSVVMEGCHIGEGTQLDYVIADRNVTIGKNVVLKGTKDSPVVLKKEMVI